MTRLHTKRGQMTFHKRDAILIYCHWFANQIQFVWKDECAYDFNRNIEKIYCLNNVTVSFVSPGHKVLTVYCPFVRSF